MPRAFPSQIIEYLRAAFGPYENLRLRVDLHEDIGAIAGFLDLFDDLPAELIILSAKDYADLIKSIGAIRFRADQYRQTGRREFFYVPFELATAWDCISKLPDQVPSTAHDLSFIRDPTLREMIGLDAAAVDTALQSGEWKGATILAASCCEALLLYGLQTKEVKVRGSIATATAAMGAMGKKLNASDLLTSRGTCSPMRQPLTTCI